MRTGAIFARGSCRALKWTALFGVVFALGVGQAAAQPEPASDEFVPGTNIVTITMSAAVKGSPPIASFAIANAGTGNSITSVDVGEGSSLRDIVITLSGNIKSGSDVEVTYTAPTLATDPNNITDLDGGTETTDVVATFADRAIDEKDVVPSLEAPDDETLPLNKRVTAIPLPEGTGGNGVLSYELQLLSSTATGVTAHEITTAAPTGGSTDTGLRFLDDPPTILGTPSLKGEHILQYTVTDKAIVDGRVTADAGPIPVPRVFTITVEDEDFTPTTDVPVKVKSVTAAASVAEGGSLEVTVTATVPAGEEVGGKVAPIASRMVKVTFPVDNAKIEDGEAAEPMEDFELLGATGGMFEWKNITRTDKASEQTFKFRVEIRRDLDAEDEKFQIAAQIDDDKPVATKDVLMIDDAQTQTYKLSLPTAAKGAITEGAEDATKLTLKADPARTMNIPVSVALSPNDPTKYMLGALSAATFGMDPTAVTVTIRALADKNRSEDTITVTAYQTDGPLGNVALASLDIKVKDANALPGIRATLVDDEGDALAMQPDSVMEGETLMVKLTALDEDGDSMKAAEKLMVSLVPAGTAGVQDYRLSGHPVEIASGKESSDPVDLMVLADDDVGEEMLVFDAVVSGDDKVGPGTKSVMGVLSLTIEDGTVKLVWAKSMDDVQESIYAAKEMGAGADEVFSPGEMIEIDASTLFNYAEGVTLNYVASSDSAAVKVGTSGSMVTATAAEAGMANVTITAHANAPSGVKVLPQGEPDEASIMFPVEVGLEALSIMLSGPEDMNVAEGMSAMVTATANRAVTEEVTVMLMHDRSMSSADADDFTADAITIAAGMSSGSTMVMAVEDMEAEDMEELVLYGMTEGMAGEVTGEVKLYIWDAAVPALPIIAQLLLAAFLAIGGYRRYLRR